MNKISVALYTSKIIKAGALIDDTKTLLTNWDVSQTVKLNLSRLQSQNIFGKATRSRVEDILVVFRQRYLDDPALIDSLLLLMVKPALSQMLDRVLFYFSAKNDRLLYDAVTCFLVSKREQGFEEITPEMMIDWINGLIENKQTITAWSEKTILRSAQELLSTLRDFGFLEGVKTKKIAPFYLPIEAFAFIAFFIFQEVASGERLIHHPDWKLFLLSERAVERFLMEAHQLHLLEYHVAGTVTRLTFPAANLEEYARVISQRTY